MQNTKKYILKNAAVFEDYVSMLVKAFKEVIDPEHPYASILQLITEGFIFSRWGFVGSAVAVLLDKGFNINIKTVLSTIQQVLGQYFDGEHKSGNVDNVASNLTQQTLSVLNISPTDAAVPFQQVQDENPEIKNAILLNRFTINKYSSKILQKEAGLWGALASFSLVGLIRAIIKAALIGAGFNAAANVMIDNQNKNNSSQTPPNTNNNAGAAVKIDNSKANNTTKEDDSILKYVGNPSGQGTTYYNNNANLQDTNGKAWYILSEGDFEDYIMDWTFSIYQDMDDDVVNILRIYLPKAIAAIKTEFVKWNPGVNIDKAYSEIRIPTRINNKELHCIKDIIDATLSLLKI